MAVSANGSCPTMMVCVLGLSREQGEDFHQRKGVGKSCFCHRFLHPGFDEYVSDHLSLLALHEFESPVINNVHFLYWGNTTRTYPIKGTTKEQKVQYHVIEQTVFYQDVTSQPFTIITKPDNIEQYIRRVTGPIESPGKVAYEDRDAMLLREDHQRQQYPPGVSKLPRGFLVLIDVSQSGPIFEAQLARVERILAHLMKHRRKYIIIATKRDIVDHSSLEKVKELRRKYRTQLLETSAGSNLNISDAFRLLASKVLKKVHGLSDHVPTYEEAARVVLIAKGSARRSFMSYLKKKVNYSADRVMAIENSEEYKTCLETIGKFETDKLFAEHLLGLHNQEVELYAGVKDNPELRQEFLEEFVDLRSDLATYAQTLKRLVVLDTCVTSLLE